MIDQNEIKDFVEKNFKPSTLEKAKYKYSTFQVMELLFQTFPNGCIEEHETYQILKRCGFKPFLDTEEDKMKTVWCIEAK